MEVKNSDERIELMNSSKSKIKKSDNKTINKNDREIIKSDVINLDRPMNSTSSNIFNSRNDKISINNFNNNTSSTNTNNENYLITEKINDLNIKQNVFDSKDKNNINNEGPKNSNFKAKQEDISIVDITKGGRIISDADINNAPVLILEVNYSSYENVN